MKVSILRKKKLFRKHFIFSTERGKTIADETSNCEIIIIFKFDGIFIFIIVKVFV